MKLITFDGGRVGRLELEEGTVIELDVPSTREYFERGGQVTETGERLAYADVKLEAPIRPKKFFHTAGNFADHHKELTAVDWSHPVHKGIVFFQNVDAIIGPEDEIVYPEGLTKELDYELELAIIIGKSGKFFGPDEADDYIAGFTVFNDITARDIQRKEMESGVFSFSKGIDTFNPIGPWIVTRDEVPDMHELPMQLRVNGEVRQQGNTNQTRIKFPHLVAYHSPQIYSAGDIITTGTISGVAAVQPNPFDFYLKPGDQIEAEITGIGNAAQQGHRLGRAVRRAGPAAGRLVRIANLGGRAVLVQGENGAIDIAGASDGRFGPDPQALFDDWAAFAEWASALERADAAASDSFDVTELGAPVPRPRQVFAIGLNYAEHAAEAGYPPDSMPVTFTKFPSSIVGPDAVVALPEGHVDWEVELVVVIGREAHKVDRESAWDHVAGLTIGQDISERITQMQGSAPQFSLGKSFPGFGPTGPWLVTPDEFADKDDLAIACSLSGEGMQSSRTSMMLYDVPELLVRLSAVCPLLPGDIIFSGTPSGIGNRRTPQRFIGPDDVLVSEIEGIGTLTTRFTAGG